MASRTLTEILDAYNPQTFSDGFADYLYDKAERSLICIPRYVTARYKFIFSQYPKINKSLIDLSLEITNQRMSMRLLWDMESFECVYPFTPAYLRFLSDELWATQEAQYFQHLIKRETYVYLIKDKDTGFTKIGRSTNPGQRLRALIKQDTLMPRPNDFYLVDFWKDSEQTEILLHQEFDTKRIRGEWFDLTDTDTSRIIKFAENRQNFDYE